MRTLGHWWGRTAGGLPREFWYLWTNGLINRVGSFVLILLAIYLTQERHLSPTFAGLVIGLWGAGGALGTLIGGVLADRWGRKPTFLVALYASAATMLTLGFVRGAWTIAVTVLLLGIVTEMARPALGALMIDIVPERDRLRAFSLNYWVINLGFAVAATTAGFVAGVDFRLLFAIDAATTVIGATVVAVTVREVVRVRVRPSAARRPSLATVFRDRIFMAYVGVNVLTGLVFMQYISTLPVAMANDGLSSSTFGTVIALNGVLIVAGQLFVPRLLGTLRRGTAMTVAALIMGVGFGLNALAHTAWVYAVAVLVWTLGEMLNAPSNSALNADLSPAHLRGRYQGVFSLSGSVAAFAAPILGSAVLQYAGATVLWLGCLGLGVVVAGLHRLASPSRERRTAELAAQTLTAPAPVRSTAPPLPVDQGLVAAI